MPGSSVPQSARYEKPSRVAILRRTCGVRRWPEMTLDTWARSHPMACAKPVTDWSRSRRRFLMVNRDDMRAHL